MSVLLDAASSGSQRARISPASSTSRAIQLWSEDLRAGPQGRADAAARRRNADARSLAGGVLSPFVSRNGLLALLSPHPRAYELVLRARMLAVGDRGGGLAVCGHFEEALRLDDRYAPAHRPSPIAIAYSAHRREAGPPASCCCGHGERPIARSSSPRASRGLCVRAWVRFSYDWDLPAARARLEHALRSIQLCARAHQYLRPPGDDGPVRRGGARGAARSRPRSAVDQ